MTQVTYNTENLIAGRIESQQVQLAADTYYKGMPLQYDPSVPTTGTADGGNTGDGTVTAVAAIASEADKIIQGDYNLECVSAVANGGVFKLEDPNGNIIKSDITMTVGAGAATVFEVGGLTFTITDGATDFIVGDKFTITVAEGTYAYLSGGKISGIFSELNSRTLSSAGYGAIIAGGEIYEGGLVDDSGSVLAINETQIAEWQSRGFYVKKK